MLNCMVCNLNVLNKLNEPNKEKKNEFDGVRTSERH